MKSRYHMRIFILTVLLLFAACPAALAGWTGNMNLFLGSKSLDEVEWAPVDSQTEVGLEFDFRQEDWPVSLAAGFMYSAGKESLLGIEFEGNTTELNIGVRKIWDHYATARPFIGGGMSMIRGEFGGIGISQSDTGTGIYLEAGVYWTLSRSVNVGLSVKGSSADISLYGIEADAGGGHFGMLVGFHF